MKKNHEFYEYAFAILPGIGRRTKRRFLMEHSEDEIVLWTEEEMKHHLSPGEWNTYLRHKKQYNNIEETQQQWEKLQEKGIHFLYHTSTGFPVKLSQIEDAPLGLFYKGTLPEFKKAIAIVGSRTPSAYGKEMAHFFARELAKEGVVIISGLASGIDVEAHKGALDGGGVTAGVMGCGPDIVYPKENYFVYENMLQRGAVLSEYQPGESPASWRFPERNRIISALSDGVLVVEARARSGSLITADCALEQGKEVYAIPGRILDPFSEGCNWLIREGAKMVTEPTHILEELTPLYEKNLEELRKSDKLLDKKEKIVYDCLSLEPKNIEDIICESHLTVSEGISILFRLELKGYVKQIVKDYYIISL